MNSNSEKKGEIDNKDLKDEIEQLMDFSKHCKSQNQVLKKLLDSLEKTKQKKTNNKKKSIIKT